MGRGMLRWCIRAVNTASKVFRPMNPTATRRRTPRRCEAGSWRKERGDRPQRPQRMFRRFGCWSCAQERTGVYLDRDHDVAFPLAEGLSVREDRPALPAMRDRGAPSLLPWPTNRVRWPDCSPFVCSRGGTTEKHPLCLHMNDARELCWDCAHTERRRADRQGVSRRMRCSSRRATHESRTR
jgi:hypothetical protein